MPTYLPREQTKPDYKLTMGGVTAIGGSLIGVEVDCRQELFLGGNAEALLELLAVHVRLTPGATPVTKEEAEEVSRGLVSNQPGSEGP